MRLSGLAAIIAGLSWLLVGGNPAALTAEVLPEPTGPVVLEISGRIGNSHADGVARFDRHMLEGLGTEKLTTSTAWTAGKAEFEGPLARDLLDLVAAAGTTVTVSAVNDYTATIPMEELRRYPVILALKMNGEYLKIKDKGPIWIVYPRDQNKDLQDSLVDKRWVWQLKHIHVE